VLLLALALCWGFLAAFFPPRLLLLDTMTAGGDTPSFHRPIQHLKDVLLPAGQPQGFDLGNFAGYAPYHFYFLPPALLVIGLSALVPFHVAFKLTTVLGTLLLPLATALCLRGLGHGFPAAAVGAGMSLLFLFNEGNSMWGGNIPSTLAGEFSHSLAFALAVLFVGQLAAGLESGTRRRRLALLLALVGLTHPVALLNAAITGLFFLLDRQRFAKNLVYLLYVYGVAALLMGFWLLPLLVKLPFATSINWTWSFGSWRELVPPPLLPLAPLAALDAVLALRGRGPEDRAGRYLLFGLLMSVAAFLNASFLGLPDVRFVPFAQFLVLLLAADLVGRLLRRLPLAALPALALVLLTLAGVDRLTGFIPGWIRWNYEGVERKTGYTTLAEISDALRGSIRDPRAAFEFSPTYGFMGSMRILESLPRLAGRATLEGLLLQTPVTSPFVYFMQSQVSERGTSVIPGYAYPDFDIVRGTQRLELFNVRDFVAATRAAQAALDADPRWRRTHTFAPFAVYRLETGDGHYVRVPRFRPALLESPDWKRAFHRWFGSDQALEVPLVAAWSVPWDERAVFLAPGAGPGVPPRQPLPADCRVEERIDHLAIEFTTTCPGLPHWLSVSFFPNWTAEGAKGPYLASPAFLMVVPEGPRVRLVWRRRAVDWLGIALSLFGVAGLAWARAARPDSARVWTERLGRLQPALLLLLIPAAFLTAWNAARLFGPDYFYRRGYAAFERQRYDEALPEFERAMRLGGAGARAADAAFFRAASLFRSERFEAAREAYQRVIDRHADSIWVAESHYHVGLALLRLGREAQARERFELLVAERPVNQWARRAGEQLRGLAPPATSGTPGPRG
jgi:tetratricopeptide (TPR) repeat protein